MKNDFRSHKKLLAIHLVKMVLQHLANLVKELKFASGSLPSVTSSNAEERKLPADWVGGRGSQKRDRKLQTFAISPRKIRWSPLLYKFLYSSSKFFIHLEGKKKKKRKSSFYLYFLQLICNSRIWPPSTQRYNLSTTSTFSLTDKLQASLYSWKWYSVLQLSFTRWTLEKNTFPRGAWPRIEHIMPICGHQFELEGILGLEETDIILACTFMTRLCIYMPNCHPYIKSSLLTQFQT